MTDDATPLIIEQQLSDELLAAVGLVTIVAAHVETTITLRILHLSGLPKEPTPGTWVLVAGMEFRVMLQKMKQLLNWLPAESKIALNNHCDKLENAMRHRNNLAHGVISGGRNASELQLLLTKVEKSGKGQPVYLKAAQIRAYARSIQREVLALERFLLARGIQPIKALPGLANPDS